MNSKQRGMTRSIQIDDGDHWTTPPLTLNQDKPSRFQGCDGTLPCHLANVEILGHAPGELDLPGMLLGGLEMNDGGHGKSFPGQLHGSLEPLGRDGWDELPSLGRFPTGRTKRSGLGVVDEARLWHSKPPKL